ncbi:MAG TPA: aspartyl protease family protein [Kofleriaceae bacterium]|nr:aspartyl protease family protein [Kofleriaceae bacterium]
MRAVALIVLASTGCAVGAPPGFGKGESWSFPLVAPLEDDVLLVPVLIDGVPQPVVFMIDPDSAVSSIDSALQQQLKPYTRQVPHEVTERDQRVPVFMAEIKKIRLGELEVENLTMRIHKAGTFWAGGRQVRGIIGRDILADSILFYADRDRGIGILATQGSLSPPPKATEVHYRTFFHRRLAKVKINRRDYTMHLDLGARTTMLWGPKIRTAALPKLSVRAELQDEYGTTWQETSGGLAAMVEMGNARVDALVVLPYGDRRVNPTDLDGALGQNFFSRFNVMVNSHEKTMWLKPRSGDIIGSAADRLTRWGNLFAGCPRPACVTIELVRGDTAQPAATGNAAPPASGQPAAGAAPVADAQPGTGEPPPSAQPAAPAPPPGTPPLREIRIAREPRAAAATYEVLLEAVSASGEPLGLPRLRATLKAGVATLVERDLAPDYAAAATLLVLDASPFPRACEPGGAGERCIWQQPVR